MITEILLGLLVLVLFVVWKIKKKFSFWDDTGIPHHTFFQYVKEEWTRTKVPYNVYAVWRYKRIPKVFGSYMGFRPKLIIADQELIKQVLVKDFMFFADRFHVQKMNHKIWDAMVLNTSGEVWRNQRAVMSPAFSTGKIKLMIPTMCQLADHVAEKFLDDARNGKTSDVIKSFGAYSMDTIAKLAFATTLNSHLDPDNQFVKCAKGLFGSDNAWKFTLLMLAPGIAKLLRLQIISKDKMDFFESITKKIIEERVRNKTKDGIDLLQLMLNAHEEDDTHENTSNGTGESHDKPKRALTMDEIIAQAVMFFLAAYDTTTSTILFTAYNLATNPETQDKLIEEIDRVIGKGPVTYEAIVNMHYLEAAIQENLRLVGADPFVIRVCTEDTTLAGIQFKKGMHVEISDHGMHNDPEYFPDPEKFNPDRFLPENKASIQPYTFMPFGDGPRHCVGMRLAMFEMKVCLAKVFQKVRLQPCAETLIPMKTKASSFTVEPAVPIILKAVERN